MPLLGSPGLHLARQADANTAGSAMSLAIKHVLPPAPSLPFSFGRGRNLPYPG